MMTLVDGSILRAGDKCRALTQLKPKAPLRWYAAEVEEILLGGGVDRAKVKLVKHGVSRLVGRYRVLKAAV